MSMAMHESVLKSIAFIEANLQSSIGVCDVANAVSYSQFYFSREFSKYTHISVYDYILRRKISESYKDLFQVAVRPKIVDLAYRYGFQSHEVYTRAFRKVFGENPSEAAVYKPLAVYESIDEQYLDFLEGLQVDIVNRVIRDCFFEVNSISAFDNGDRFLVLLARENLLVCNCILQGNLSHEQNQYLCFKLSNLKHKIRIHHTDIKLSFRYFIDYFYDTDEMGSNYVLIIKEKNYIDIALSDNLL
jgi:AraC-like DNA-binding protein